MTTNNLIPGASKGRTFPAEPLTLAECQTLLAWAEIDARPRWTGLRMKAALVLMWRAGLRASEALNVRERDFDFDNGLLRVRDGKHGKTAAVALDPDAIRILMDWQAERRKQGASPSGQWLQAMGRPEWTYHSMNLAVKRLAKRAGITKRVSCHQFRHTMAAHMADEQVDLRIIQQQLRHENIHTTHRYVNHLNPTALADAISQRPGFINGGDDA